MYRAFTRFGLLTIVTALSVAQLAAQSGAPGNGELTWRNGIGHSSWDLALEPADRKRMLSLWDSIGEDLKTEKNELAGTFLKGGYNSGYFLRWSVAKGFVVVPYFDQNLIA